MCEPTRPARHSIAHSARSWRKPIRNSLSSKRATTANGASPAIASHRPTPRPSERVSDAGQICLGRRWPSLAMAPLFLVSATTKVTETTAIQAYMPAWSSAEAVGLVEEAPEGEFAKGEIVATAMGGMGRNFDGGYAEYTCVPTSQVLVIKTSLAWETLGALPEMLQTAWGSLFKSLRLGGGERLLIRGGTTSIGLAAAAIGKNHGAIVASTTRRSDREHLLRSSGA